MSDNNETNGSAESEGQCSADDEGRPRRVIGTPSPTEGQELLPPDGGSDDEEELDPRKARKTERLVASLFFLSFLAGIAFLLAYAAWPGTTNDIGSAQSSNYALGITMTIVFFGLAAGITIWVRHLMTTKEVTQDRGQLASSADDREAATEHFMQGAKETGITKRPLLRRTLLLATVPLGIAPLFLLRDLGPLPRKKLRHTAWKAGDRLVVDGTDQPLKATDFSSPGSMITVLPEGIGDDLDAVGKAAVLLLHVPEEKLTVEKGRENWHVGGIIAYSKICTHVGCPAALYEQTTHHILCPCHQSTFDALDGAKVIFGPAARPLPQLPIDVDSQGYLIARSDFHEPVGPSFWERGRPNPS